MSMRYRSAEERAAAIDHVKRLQKHGLPPAGPVASSGRRSSAAAAANDGYDADEDLGNSEGYNAKKFQMPNGRWLWVHPLGLEQILWLNRHATKHLASLNLPESDPGRVIGYKVLAWVYQAIACCRKGPQPDAPYVYTTEHAERLFRDPNPGSECIQQICAWSDQLGKANGADALTEAQADFFGETASWLWTCASRLTTDSLETSREALMEFGRYVARIKQHGELSKDDLAELVALFELLPPPAAERETIAGETPEAATPDPN